MLTVNETSVEPPVEDSSVANSPNSPRNLALEATMINHNFSQQVLKTVRPSAFYEFNLKLKHIYFQGEAPFKFDEPNPFVSDDEAGQVASVAYRYRKWDLGSGVILICRCEHDAVMTGPNGESQYLSIKALNEWDSKVNLSSSISVNVN